MSEKLRAEWFWVDRWILSSAFLMPIEPRGLYREMLTAAWGRGGELPSDFATVCRIINATKEEWDRCWPEVSRYWKQDGSKMYNETQREVLRASLTLSEKRALAGKRGGIAKAQASSKRLASEANGVAKPLAKPLANDVAKTYPLSLSLSPSQDQTPNAETTTDMSRSPPAKHDASASPVAEVVAYYRQHHPRARPGKKEQTKIRQRLAEGFTVDDLRDAIDGCHASPWHCGDNKDGRTYQNLELIVRDATKTQQFIELKARAGNAMLGERLSKTKTNLEAWGEEMAHGLDRIPGGNGTARSELREGDPRSDHRRLLASPPERGNRGLDAGGRNDHEDREALADPGGDPEAR